VLVCMQEGVGYLTLRYRSSLGIVKKVIVMCQHWGVGNVSNFETR
jgi:hypothetical protein